MHQKSALNHNEDKEIDLLELFLILWDKKFLIGLVSSISALFSVLYALYLPNIYTSQTILAPTEAEGSLYSQVGSLSAIAGLTSIGLPTGNSSKSQEAVERIKSFDFFSKYFLPDVKLENIVAVSRWVSEGNEIIYDESIFNSETSIWEENISEQKAFKLFKERLNIDLDNKTSFVTLSINHKSPFIAKQWVDIITNNINESMRELDVENAKNSIIFLNESTKSTSVLSIKEVINSILERQMQTLMLASSNKAYVFKIIDSAVVPELKSGPSRAFISIVGTFIGIILSMFIAFFQHYRESYKS